jgi:hypothetical protein
VKYRKGDCLFILRENGKYIRVIVSDKYITYHDIMLVQFYENQKPQLSDFIEGKNFGIRFGSLEEMQYAVNYRTMKYKYNR